MVVHSNARDSVGSVGGVGGMGRNYKTYISSPLLCRTTILFSIIKKLKRLITEEADNCSLKRLITDNWKDVDEIAKILFSIIKKTEKTDN